MITGRSQMQRSSLIIISHVQINTLIIEAYQALQISIWSTRNGEDSLLDKSLEWPPSAISLFSIFVEEIEIVEAFIQLLNNADTLNSVALFVKKWAKASESS
jgi:hypothetical protein